MGGSLCGVGSYVPFSTTQGPTCGGTPCALGAAEVVDAPPPAPSRSSSRRARPGDRRSRGAGARRRQPSGLVPSPRWDDACSPFPRSRRRIRCRRIRCRRIRCGRNRGPPPRGPRRASRRPRGPRGRARADAPRGPGHTDARAGVANRQHPPPRISDVVRGRGNGHKSFRFSSLGLVASTAMLGELDIRCPGGSSQERPYLLRWLGLGSVSASDGTRRVKGSSSATRWPPSQPSPRSPA